MATAIATAPRTAKDILQMQLNTIALAVEKALPHITKLDETASDVLIRTLAIGARIAVDIDCPSECTYTVKDNIYALQQILEPFATLESYTNDTANIVCEHCILHLQKINIELA
jgi:hypothetical protein